MNVEHAYLEYLILPGGGCAGIEVTRTDRNVVGTPTEGPVFETMWINFDGGGYIEMGTAHVRRDGVDATGNRSCDGSATYMGVHHWFGYLGPPPGRGSGRYLWMNPPGGLAGGGAKHKFKMETPHKGALSGRQWSFTIDQTLMCKVDLGYSAVGAKPRWGLESYDSQRNLGPNRYTGLKYKDYGGKWRTPGGDWKAQHNQVGAVSTGSHLCACWLPCKNELIVGLNRPRGAYGQCAEFCPDGAPPPPC